jgi:hypothetical protein
VIEKDVEGGKRKYLVGVSSGLATDAHRERMSEKAIESFMKQANSGEILLYPDIHGIKASKDIGRLTECKVMDNGDWYTEYALYNENDFDSELHKEKLSTIDTVWRQLNGLSPYEKPMQKGFSIEGYVPSGKIKTNTRGENIIDDVMLDGVILCPRPAYETGIANAVYKSLGVCPDWVEEKVKKNIRGKLSEIISNKETQSQYYQRKFEIDEAFEQSIYEIMKDPKPNKQERLSIVFDEYKNIMIGHLISFQDMFEPELVDDPVIIERSENIQKCVKEFQKKLILLKPLIEKNQKIKRRPK